MKFVYDFGKVVDYDWNLDTLTYDPIYEYDFGNEAPGWDKESVEIRFKNFSNRDVYCCTSFEKNNEDVYRNVELTTENSEVHLASAVGRSEDELDVQGVTYTIDGAPLNTIDPNNVPELGVMRFGICEHSRVTPPPAEEEEETQTSGEHECHFVYDQFGRLVCTGCNKVKHEFCIDEDEDGLCDECGLERDFCPDCHVGGKCVCT